MIPDYNDFCDMHERQQEMKLSRLPVCRHCGEPITSENAYDIDGYWCEDCFNEWVHEITVLTEEI